MKKQVVIIGSGGLGRETLWAFQAPGGVRGAAEVEILGFLTNIEKEHGREVCGVPVLGGEEWVVGRRDVEAICCIGDPRARRAIVEKLAGQGVAFATAIHPSVEMSDHVRLGEGCVVGAGAVLTSQVEVGSHVVIGVNAVVSHDAVVEDFATISPGVVLAGTVRIKSGADIGVNATVIPRMTVGLGAVVGAQSAVVEDVADNVVVAGVPAKVVSHVPEPQRWR